MKIEIDKFLFKNTLNVYKRTGTNKQPYNGKFKLELCHFILELLLYIFS